MPSLFTAPPAGPGEYDYSGSRLSGLGWYLILFGCFWSAAVGFMFYAALTMPSQDSPVPFFFALIPFSFVGVGLIVLGISYVMCYRNEQIILTPRDVTWINRRGVECLRFTLDQVKHAEEKTLSEPSSSRYYAPMHHRCIVDTVPGRLVFSDEIENYEGLKSFFVNASRHQIGATAAQPDQPQIQGYQVASTFRYRSPVIFGVAAFVIPLTLLLVVGFGRQYVNGDMMKVNGHLEQTPIWAPLFVILISSVFWVAVGYGILSYLNERIVVSSDRVVYYNVSGRKKVDVPLSWVEKGSLTRTSNRNSYKYSVATPQGRISWSDQISNCTDLVTLMEQVSGGPDSSKVISVDEPGQITG